MKQQLEYRHDIEGKEKNTVNSNLIPHIVRKIKYLMRRCACNIQREKKV